MYKLIELTDNGQRIVNSEYISELILEATDSQNAIIIIDTKTDLVRGIKEENAKIKFCEEQIKQAFNISTFEGYVTFEIGYVTEDYSFMVEKKEYLVEDIVEDLEGFHIHRGMLYFCEADEETYHKFEDYEMSEDNVKEFIKVQGYEYTEL